MMQRRAQEAKRPLVPFVDNHLRAGRDYMQDVDAWLLLNASGLPPARQVALLEAFGSVSAIFGATDEQLCSVGSIHSQHVSRLRDVQARIDPAMLGNKLRELDVHLVTWGSEAYPKWLANTDVAPSVLFVQGDLLADDRQAVAIVGTRKCTPYGRQVARRLAGDLARRGFTIVSGMADGIDAEAHEGALQAGGRTIAVMASGPDITYPRTHGKLRERIAAQGAVLTEYGLGTEPLRERFPARNRIISGLSLGVLVVEAPVKSGAMITARHAAEQGREVFAVPGPVDSPTSQGCHALIKDGVQLVENAEDIVEGLGIMLEAVPSRQSHSRQQPDLPRDEAAVMNVLSFEPTIVDLIAEQVELPVAAVNAVLMMLEMKGLVRRFPGNAYVKIS
jgi:DNA processing protein